MELTEFEKGRIYELKQLAVGGKAKINMIGFKDYIHLGVKNIRDEAKSRKKTRPVVVGKTTTGAEK